MAKKQLTIRIHRADNKELYFTLNGGNGKVIMTSETYKRRQGVNRAVETILWGIADGEYSVLAEAGEIVKDQEPLNIGGGFATMRKGLTGSGPEGPLEHKSITTGCCDTNLPNIGSTPCGTLSDRNK